MTNDNDCRLTAKEVADILGFTITNLKHYASLLELNGLKIFRNTRNHREYSEHDVKLLRTMQTLNRDKSLLLEDAASLVMASDTDIDTIQDEGSTERLLAHISALMADNKSLREELHARDKLVLDFQSDISNKMEQQAKIIAEQSALIETIRAELEGIRKVAEEKPSVWSGLFSR
ncbi:MerR family transcriptional regulator [Lysinibacillus xylanilyticus]|uniref:Helix-turn-helix domain-containing protein n=1 Tax=Lysinibacillus xylanilyticus TaxID=582475 RepID=A0ABT4EWD2_9BACI|nr:MerR family transcriptional regulator [Lysinibacillus xylanilyticus]MCY9549984.1 helix-turn-helix domain-containing protein [Lysinibacillus xylanilyticus]